MAAGARPILSLDSMKCCGKECDSTFCEAFNSSFSPSENKNENVLCLLSMKQEIITNLCCYKLQCIERKINETDPPEI
jgi:hypothetical protein